MKMRIEEFEEAVRKDDFAIGDSFWLGDWEFEVVSRRGHGAIFDSYEAVFHWELTRQDFIQVITDNHPEIENPQEFFDEHKDDIIERFRKGFDVLVGGCGATYGTIINDAIDEVISQNRSPMTTKKAGDCWWQVNHR